MSTYVHEDYYLQVKLAQLRSKGEKDADGKEYTRASLLKAIADGGMTVQSHYELYGRAEGLNPNPYFNESEYLSAKLRQLQSIKSVDAAGNAWTLTSLKAAIAAAGMTPAEHYETFGAYEKDASGHFINPSNAFDANAYFSAKLYQTRLSGESVNGDTGTEITMTELIAALQESGMSPATHYLLYGAKEAEQYNTPLVQTVPATQRVSNDPGRAELNDVVPANYNPATPAPTDNAPVRTPPPAATTPTPPAETPETPNSEPTSEAPTAVVFQATAKADTANFNSATADRFITTSGLVGRFEYFGTSLEGIALAKDGSLTITVGDQEITYSNTGAETLRGEALAEALKQGIGNDMQELGWNLYGLSLQATEVGNKDVAISVKYSSAPTTDNPISVAEYAAGGAAVPGKSLTVIDNYFTWGGHEEQFISLNGVYLAPNGTIVVGEQEIFKNETLRTLAGDELAYAIVNYNADGTSLSDWAIWSLNSYIQDTLHIGLSLQAKTAGDKQQLTASYSSAEIAEVQEVFLYSEDHIALGPNQILYVGSKEYKNETGQALSMHSLAEKIADLAEKQSWSAEIFSSDYGPVRLLLTSPNTGTNEDTLTITYTIGEMANVEIPISSHQDGRDKALSLSSLANMDVITGFTIGQDKIKTNWWYSSEESLPGFPVDTGTIDGVTKEIFSEKAEKIGGYGTGLYQYQDDSYLLITNGPTGDNGQVFNPDMDIVIKLVGVTLTEQQAASLMASDLLEFYYDPSGGV
jgi:hypothetical protein